MIAPGAADRNETNFLSLLNSTLISPNCSALISNLTSSVNSTDHNAHAEAIAILHASGDCNESLYPDPGEHGLAGYGGGPNPWWANLIVQILYGIVCLIGLCGNTLVIYVVVRFSKMQTVTNLYIVNLAIADECFLVGIPFLMTTASLGYWPFGNIVCKAYFTSTSINQITSSMFLLIMSADRYLAVCHPISAPKWRTPFIAKLVALTAWTLSALIMVPIFMYANTLEVDQAINCNIFWPDTGGWTGETVFIVYSLIISFAVPLSLIMIFYVLVIRKLRTVGPKRKPPQPSTPAPASNGNKADNNGRSPNSAGGVATTANSNHVIITPQQANRARDRKKSHRKVTKLVLTVITVYFLCWAPYWTMQLALIFTPHEQARHSGVMLFLFLFCGCLSYSNSAMNPILYAFLSENFKKSFLKACTCARGQGWSRGILRFVTRWIVRGSGSTADFRDSTNEFDMTMTDLTRTGESRGLEQDTDDDDDYVYEIGDDDDDGEDAVAHEDNDDDNNEDVNAALHVENSVFPRGRKSEKARKGMAVSATSGSGPTGGGANGGITGTATSGTTPTTKHLLQVPPPQSLPSPVSDVDDSGEESDDEGAAILRNNKRFNTKMTRLNTTEQNAQSTSSFLNSPPTSGGSNENGNANETFVKDGVHVTSL
ncbi:unnamed protein product [Orchesella dallaii]|uniref:G-protein coupled receptors family 1 profile domain-containing protein n=1 Tax=Orchesella dallaii TaxID=48710 RepID=A0ABP1RCZ1_9HEXA